MNDEEARERLKSVIDGFIQATKVEENRLRAENTKLRQELCFLREQATDILDDLQSYEWWEDKRNFINQYPNEKAYDVLNRAEFAEALNMLFLALHPDVPDELCSEQPK